AVARRLALGQALPVLVLHRRLEAHGAQLLEGAADADGALDRIAVVRVERERKAFAHERAHGPRLRDVAGEVDVARGLVGVEADLHLRGPELEPLLDHAAHLVRAALAVAADRGIKGQLAPPGAAEELAHGLAEDLAAQIPPRNVDGGQRTAIG